MTMLRTNPAGRIFISYRRTRVAEASLLVEALHDHGIPTWVDTSDLAFEPAPDALEAVLTDSQTAGAILLLTSDAAESPTIKTVEAPGLLSRARAARNTDDPFLLVPIAAGGLPRGDAAKVLAPQKDLGQLRTHNMEQFSAVATVEEARQIARRILAARLRALHLGQGRDEAMQLRIHTRASPGYDAGAALSMDWTHRFKDRFAHPAAWIDAVLPALETISKTLAAEAPGRVLVLSGQCAIAAAFAAGSALRSPRGFKCAWRQELPNGAGQQDWSNGDMHQDHPFQVKAEAIEPSSRDLAILVGVNADVRAAVARTTDAPSVYSAAINVSAAKAGTQIAGSGQAAKLAADIELAVRAELERNRATTRIHLFMAAPLGLAFLLGQRTNTFPPIQLYEFDAAADGGTQYRKACLLDPSGILAIPAASTRDRPANGRFSVKDLLRRLAARP